MPSPGQTPTAEPVLHALSRAGRALGLCLALAPGCSDFPNHPAPSPPPIRRTARVVVTDSLGIPAAAVDVRLVGERDSAGFARVVQGITDAEGGLGAVLIEGEWGVHARRRGSARTVAGATFVVFGATRPDTDTVLVRIALHTPSLARGRVLLGGRTNHSGVAVDCPPVPTAMVTDSTGTYVMDLLPPGHWTITMFETGFRMGLAPIDVGTPGDTLSVPDVLLISDPNDNRPQ